MRVPTPRERFTPSPGPQFEAGRVAPLRDATGQQLQQLGEGVAAAGSAIGGVGDHLQREWDDAQVNEADLRVADLIQTKLGEYRSREGRTALGDVRPKLLEEVEREVERIGVKTLTNTHQQARYQRAAGARLSQFRALTQDHEIRQLRAYNIGTTKARVDTTMRDALDALDTPLFDVHAKVMRRTVRELAELQGLGEEEANALTLAATTQLHTGVIDRMLEGDRPGDASTYLAAHRNEIESFRRTKLEGAVRSASDTHTAKQTAIQLDDLPTLAARAAEADRRFTAGDLTAEAHSKLMNELEARQRLTDQETARRRSDLMTRATSVLDENRRLAAQGEDTLGGVEDVLPALLVQELKDNGLYGDAERYASAGRWVTTNEGRLELNAMSDTLLVNRPWQMVESYFRPLLDDRDMSYLRSRWEGVNEPKQGPKPYDLNTDRDFVDTQISRILGPLPDDATPEQLQARRLFVDELEQRVNLVVSEKNPPSRDLVRGVVNEWLVERVEMKGGGGDPTYLAAVPPDKLNDYQVVYTDPTDGQKVAVPFEEVFTAENLQRSLAIGAERVEVLRARGRMREAAALELKLANRNPHTLGMILAEDIKATGDLAARNRRAENLAEMKRAQDLDARIDLFLGQNEADGVTDDLLNAAFKSGVWPENARWNTVAQRDMRTRLAAGLERRQQRRNEKFNADAHAREVEIKTFAWDRPHETPEDIERIVDELVESGKITEKSRKLWSTSLRRYFFSEVRGGRGDVWRVYGPPSYDRPGASRAPGRGY